MTVPAEHCIVVVGDVMLDVYEEGQVDRLSPEAPVPILHNPKARDVLGGAANTAMNVVALGQEVGLVGIVGKDDEGDRCRSLVQAFGFGGELKVIEGWPTITKRRFLAGGQQILRIDREEPLDASSTRQLQEELPRLLTGVVGVVISDYDKGTVSDGIARESVRLAAEQGVPCVIDSKRADPGIYFGCTVIAPNHLEAARMTGTANPKLAAERIAERTGSAVIVTLGADGMLLCRDRHVETIRSRAQEVADVTGAGDSVTAGVAVALVEGRDLLEAAYFATDVAAVAVAHKGTYAVSRSELSAQDGD